MSKASKVGPRNAETNAKGIRFYTWQGHELPSVTSLRRLTGMPFPLANWMVEQAISFAVEHSSGLDAILAADGEDAAKSWLRKSSMGDRDAAANRGTAVHAAAAEKMDVAKVSAEVAGPLAMYYDFLAKTKAIEIMSERQVFNLTLGYGGSLDVILEMPDGRRLVTDLKTGKGLYLDHALQLIAYAMGEFIGEDDVVDPIATQQLHSAHGLALLHLGDTDWELVEIQPTPELFAVFKAMCTFAHWQHENASLDALITRRTSK